MSKSRKPEKFLLRVDRGRLEPADGYTARRLREKGYRVGDVLSAQLTKPRNPGFHRLVHAFGQMVADNIPDFEGMDGHRVIKRLQWEGNIGCEEMGVQAPGVGYVTVRIPLSLSFASMDDGAFREVYRALCRHVAEKYWPELSAEEVEAMAELMPQEAA